MGKELLGSIELNRIYQMDCLEGMKLIPDKSINLIVIDPPYNIGKDKRWDKWKTVSAYVEWMGNVFTECERALMDNGSFYFFHNDFLQLVELQNWLNKNSKFVFKQLIVWNKKYKGVKNEGFLQGFIELEGLRNYQKMVEYCLFYTLKKINTHLGHRKAEHCFYWKTTQWDMPIEEIYQSLTDSFNINKWDGFREYESLREEYEEYRYTYNNQKTHHSVWDYEIAKKQGHCTPKPIELIENIIKHSSNKGDIILDCFMGSGTTAIACILNKRKWIGFETEPKYIELANKRLEQIQLEDDLKVYE